MNEGAIPTYRVHEGEFANNLNTYDSEFFVPLHDGGIHVEGPLTHKVSNLRVWYEARYSGKSNEYLFSHCY